jgi:hypothetical protein
MYDKTPLPRWVGEGFVDIRRALFTFLLFYYNMVEIVKWFVVYLYKKTSDKEWVCRNKAQRMPLKVICCFFYWNSDKSFGVYIVI